MIRKRLQQAILFARLDSIYPDTVAQEFSLQKQGRQVYRLHRPDGRHTDLLAWSSYLRLDDMNKSRQLFRVCSPRFQFPNLRHEQREDLLHDCLSAKHCHKRIRLCRLIPDIFACLCPTYFPLA